MFQKILFFLIFLSTSVGAKVDIYGHRGVADLVSENTIPSFQTAMSIGVDVLDMDVHLSKDRQVVVAHDPFLNPEITKDVNGHWIKEARIALNSLTLKEIQSYTVGELKPKLFSDRKLISFNPSAETKIPSLDEVIQFAERLSQKQIRYQIEIKTKPFKNDYLPDKHVLLEKILLLIEKHQIRERVILQSFDFEVLLLAMQKRPKISTAFVTTEDDDCGTVTAGHRGELGWLANHTLSEHQGSLPRLLKFLGATIWNPYYKDLTQSSMNEAHKLGLKVVPWTVNQESEMKLVLDLKVDGIITNRPDKLRGIMASRNLALPKPVVTSDQS